MSHANAPSNKTRDVMCAKCGHDAPMCTTPNVSQCWPGRVIADSRSSARERAGGASAHRCWMQRECYRSGLFACRARPLHPFIHTHTHTIWTHLPSPISDSPILIMNIMKNSVRYFAAHISSACTFYSLLILQIQIEEKTYHFENSRKSPINDMKMNSQSFSNMYYKY